VTKDVTSIHIIWGRTVG